MWKAILVLLLSAPGKTPGMEVGVFPQTFVGEKSCETFNEKVESEMDKIIALFTKDSDTGIEVEHYELVCVETDEGEAV